MPTVSGTVADREGNTAAWSTSWTLDGGPQLPYVGAAFQGNADPTPMETSAGRSLGVHVTYWNLEQVDQAVAQARADKANGRIASLSFKLPNQRNAAGQVILDSQGKPIRQTWAMAAAGQADAQVIDLAAKLGALDTEVWPVWHHEPQGDPDGTSAQFQAFNNRLNALLVAGCPKAKTGLCLIAWNTYASGNTSYALSKWLPADGVDILAMDFYNPYGTGTPKSTTWTLLSKYADKIAADAKAIGADWMIRETGQTDEAFAHDPTAMGKDFDAMAQNTILPGLAWCYFNSGLNSDGSWPLGGAKQQAFNTNLNRSRAAA